MSSLIWVYTVCLKGFYNISADDKANGICCDLHFKLRFLYGIFMWMKNNGDLDLDLHYFEKRLLNTNTVHQLNHEIPTVVS